MDSIFLFTFRSNFLLQNILDCFDFKFMARLSLVIIDFAIHDIYQDDVFPFING